MSHPGQNFNGGVERYSASAADSLKAIAQRLDRLQNALSQVDSTDSIDRAEIVQQLQQDARLLQHIADGASVETAAQQVLSCHPLSCYSPSLNPLSENRVVAAMLRFCLYADRPIEAIEPELPLGNWEALSGYGLEAAGIEAAGIEAAGIEAAATCAFRWPSGILPADREAIVFPALEALKTQSFLSIEYRFCHRDGSLRWFQSHLMAQRDEEADCWIVTCIVTDITERKQNEQDLRRVQEQYAKAFRASPIAMSISRLSDGCYVEANDRFLELVGRSREELIGKTSIELGIFQPEERAFLLLLLLDTPGPVEWWFHTPNSKRRLARISSETIELNNEPHLLVLAEDVTDYRRVQAGLQQLNEELESMVYQRTQELQASQIALQTSQRQLEAVLDHSPLVIYLLDLENRHLMVNRRYEELVGLSRQELIGVTLESIWGGMNANGDALAAQTAFDHIRQVRETGKTIDVEEVLYIGQQQRIYLSSKFPLFDSYGNLYAVGGICLDVTERMRVEEERKRAEAVVAQREREYRTLVENSPDVIVRVDHEGRYLYVSPSFSHAFGISQRDCIGKTNIEIDFPPDLAALWQKQLGYLFDRCEPQTIEFSMLMQAELRFYQSWAVPELDDQGKVISALIIGRDITGMKQAEQRLQQAVTELERLNRLKDEFLSTVSHELRTPVSNMKMSARMLGVAMQQVGFEPDARMRQYLAILSQECDREISLINDLLDLQKLEANHQDLILEPIDLANWLPPLIEPFQERARNRQQHLQLELPETALPVLISNASSLDRILAELLNNACKYTPPGERIVLRAAASPKNILLSVQNSGAEIPLNELPRIFDKFYRVPSTDPWKQGGTGLGLALVQKLVDHLQGSIRVESGAGNTVFTVTLPIQISS